MEAAAPVLCPVCRWYAEASQWRREFARAVELLEQAAADPAQLSDTAAVVEIFRRISAQVEVAEVTEAMVEAACTLPLGRGAELSTLLLDATKAMHPQAAIQNIMAELCAQFAERSSEARS